MAIQQGSSANIPTASPEDAKHAQLIGAFRAFIAPNQTPAQKKANEAALQRGLRALGLNDDLAKELTKQLVALPAEQLAETMKLMQLIATEQAKMSIKAANEWMDTNIRQGRSISGIVNIARMISTVARYFGAEDFAKTLDERSDVIMADAQKYFQRVPAEQLAAQGKEIADKAFVTQLQSFLEKQKQTADASYQGGQTVNQLGTYSADGVTGQPGAGGPATQPPATSPAARQEITRQQFRSEVFRITGDARIADEVTKSTFDPSSNIPGGKKGVIDKPIEESALVGKIGENKRLNDAQRAELYQKLNLRAPAPEPT
jgi:hypothetical protein